MTISEGKIQSIISDFYYRNESVLYCADKYMEPVPKVEDLLREQIRCSINAAAKPERKPVSICFDPKTKELYTLYDDHTVWLTYMQRNLASVTSKTILISDHTESKDWIE